MFVAYGICARALAHEPSRLESRSCDSTCCALRSFSANKNRKIDGPPLRNMSHFASRSPLVRGPLGSFGPVAGPRVRRIPDLVIGSARKKTENDRDSLDP